MRRSTRCRRPARRPEHHHVERHFEHLAAAAEDQPVFRYDQLERPCVIGHVVGQCADVVRGSIGLPTPRVEPRPDAESVCGECSRPRRRSVPSAQVISPSRARRRCGQQLLLWRFSTTQSTKIESLSGHYLLAVAPVVGVLPARERNWISVLDVDNQLALPAGQRCRKPTSAVHSSPGRVRDSAPQFSSNSSGAGSRRSGRRRPDRGRPGVRSPPAAASTLHHTGRMPSCVSARFSSCRKRSKRTPT